MSRILSGNTWSSFKLKEKGDVWVLLDLKNKIINLVRLMPDVSCWRIFEYLDIFYGLRLADGEIVYQRHQQWWYSFSIKFPVDNIRQIDLNWKQFLEIMNISFWHEKFVICFCQFIVFVLLNSHLVHIFYCHRGLKK